MDCSLFTRILMIIHIICGSISLISTIGAMILPKGDNGHKFCGRIFFYSMTGIFVTAIPIAIIKNNLFLFFIAIFSYYFALSGWRYVKNRSGIATKFDSIINYTFLISSFAMVIFGITSFVFEKSNAIVLIVFGVIGVISSVSNIKTQRNRLSYKLRILAHLQEMLGATIAIVTAFLVTNFHSEPRFILWLIPTVIIVPLIVWYKNKLSKLDKDLV